MMGGGRRWSGAKAHFLLLVAGLGCAHGATAQPLPNRVLIDILVVADDPEAIKQMKQWSNALQSRLMKIGHDSSFGLARGHQILARSFPQQSFVSSGALKQRWQQRRAIQIVLAQGVREGNLVTAEGDIYLGDLKGPDLDSPLVAIKQPITPRNHQQSSDYILMTSLYALSVDAGPRRATSCKLLHQANLLGGRIAASIDAANVRRAVTKRLARVGCAVAR